MVKRVAVLVTSPDSLYSLARSNRSSSDARIPLSQAIQSAKPRRKGRVELQEDEEYDTDIGTDDTQEHSESIERLIRDDAAYGGGAYFVRHLLFQKTCSLSIAPTGEQSNPKQEQIEPVHYQSNTVRDECSKEPRREWHQRNGQQES